MVEFLHLRQSTSPRHRWTPRRKIANHNSYHESTSPSLQTLARKGKFDLLLEELQGMDKERFMIIMQQQQQQQPDHVVGRKKSKKNANKQDASSSCSLLHAVLAHRPPLHVVELLLQRTSECCTNIAVPEEIKDAHGRTPLHVAVASGCDVQVIDRLLSGVSLVVPALTKDVYERYPLHYAVCCDMPLHKTNQRKRKGSSSKSSSDNDRQRETVYLLLNTYPVAVVIPDVYGKTPLEYARENRHCLKDASHIVDALESVAKHHASYKVKKPVAAAAPPVPPSSKRLKRRNYLFSSSSKGSASPAVAPPTAEMTERESIDGDNDALLVPLRGLSSSSTTRSPSKRRVVRLEQNAQQDDMSTLGFDVASSSGPASVVVHRQRRKSSSQRMSTTRPARPMVRAKNLTMSLTPAAAAATTTDRPMVRAKTLTLSSSPAKAVAAATTSLMIAPASSNVQCRCKTLLRGRLKKKRSSASKKKMKKPEPVIEEEEDQEEETQQEAQDSDQEEMDEPPGATTEGARTSSSWLWIF